MDFTKARDAFGYLAVLAILTFLAFHATRISVYPAVNALFMASTTGTIRAVRVESDVVNGQSGGIPYVGNAFYVPIIEYGYAVQGSAYVGRRYALVGGSFDTAAGAQSVINRYPVGSAVTVWYSRWNPGYAVLVREVSLWQVAFGAVLLAVYAAFLSRLWIRFRLPGTQG